MNKILIILVIVVSIFLISCNPTVQQCSIDADCMPAQCCHPTGAIDQAHAPDCSGVVCTMSCEGPLDCGQGEVKCVSHKCSVVPLS